MDRSPHWASRLSPWGPPSYPQEAKGSVAVRVALGETQLVQEVRRFLLDHGVCLDAFSQVGAQGDPAEVG